MSNMINDGEGEKFLNMMKLEQHDFKLDKNYYQQPLQNEKLKREEVENLLSKYIKDFEIRKYDAMVQNIIYLLVKSNNPYQVIGILLETVNDIENLLKSSYERKPLQFIVPKENIEKIFYNENDVLNMIEKYDREFKINTFAYTKASTFTVKDWFDKNKK